MNGELEDINNVVNIYIPSQLRYLQSIMDHHVINEIKLHKNK